MNRWGIRGTCAVVAVVCSLALAAAEAGAGQAAQRPGVPQRDTQKPREGTGAIRGQVFAADQNAPLRRARVRLSSPEMQLTRMATTDAEGRFEFKKLPAGHFNLNASKGSYMALDYGQRRPFERGKPVELGQGQVLEKVNFTLPRGGVIMGRVTDDFGDPVADVQVTAMRLEYSDGRRRPSPVGRIATTNDIGAYRLYGLPPGDFYVGTVFSMGGGMMGGADSEEGFVYAPTYYPGTASVTDAARVALKLGQERSNIDLVLVSSRTASVSGTAVNSKGFPAVGATVSITQTVRSSGTSGGVMMSRSSSGSGASVQADGSFKITGLAPGEYELALSANNPETGEEEAAGLPVTMNGTDITGVSLVLTAGATLRGSIVFEGGEPNFAPRVLRAMGSTPGGMPGVFRMSAYRSTTVRDDWSVEVKGLEGQRVMRLTGLPPDWTLKGVSLDGRDICDTPYDFRDDVQGAQFVVTNIVSRVVGTVADARGETAREYTVLIFADDPARWTPLSRYRTITRPDQNGEFKAEKLPPGNYLAIALDYLDESDASDPEFLGRVRDHATRFSLGDGETKALALKLAVINQD